MMPRVAVNQSGAPIKLLVMDLDGTLLPHDGEISPRTIAAIRAARDRGVHTTISSGRNIPSFLHHAQRVGVNGPLLGMQGAIARDLPTVGEKGLGKLLRHVPFPSHLGARAVAWCSENGLWGHAVIRELYRFDERDPHRHEDGREERHQRAQRRGEVDAVQVLAPPRSIEERAEPFAQRVGVGRVGQQREVRDARLRQPPQRRQPRHKRLPSQDRRRRHRRIRLRLVPLHQLDLAAHAH